MLIQSHQRWIAVRSLRSVFVCFLLFRGLLNKTHDTTVAQVFHHIESQGTLLCFHLAEALHRLYRNSPSCRIAMRLCRICQRWADFEVVVICDRSFMCWRYFRWNQTLWELGNLYAFFGFEQTHIQHTWILLFWSNWHSLLIQLAAMIEASSQILCGLCLSRI